MALQTVTLEVMARAFGVHPRTILRAITGEHNTYWTEDSNTEDQNIEKVADRYHMRPSSLIAVLENRDALLTAGEAALVLGMANRTFRKHLTRGKNASWGRIHCGGITRYLKSKIITAAFARSPE